MQQIETEITIHAAPETVWRVLSGFDQYPAWNPFITSISGEQRPGAKLTVRIQPPGSGGMTFKPTVLAFTAPTEFRWKGKLFLPGLFDGEHYFRLEKTGDNTTRFVHGEKFSGILVSLLGGMLDKTKEGFALMNDALKKECEESTGNI